jgi:hypothetical protein
MRRTQAEGLAMRPGPKPKINNEIVGMFESAAEQRKKQA